MEKIWQFKPEVSEDFIDRFPEMNPIISQLLFDRGLDTQEKIDEFLNCDFNDLHDPFLFNDMEKAVKRIFTAIKKNEKIVIYGDYDADGVSSTVIVYKTLKLLGFSPEVYIPYREKEGYGLNIPVCTELINKKINLIITVDCGISSLDEIKLLKKNGIDVIVTDHHNEPLKLPPAYAIINPKLAKERYHFKFLAGAGVAYKLAQSIILRQEKFLKKNIVLPGQEKWFLDLVAIGTITDIVPMLGENRTLAKYGLLVLKKTRNLGIRKIFEKAGVNMNLADTFSVGFQLGPRINAAGRMAHASTAYNLLTTETEQTAVEIADDLEGKNQERQKQTLKIIEQARRTLGEVSNKKILIAVGQWPLSLVGLVAGKLCDEFHRPVLIITSSEDGYSGSGRSIEKFNITSALQKCRELLEKFGGHSQACGFSIKDKNNLDKFLLKIEKIAESEITDDDMVPTILIDKEVALEDINWDLYSELKKFEPFGNSNEKPKFMARRLKIVDLQTVGQDNRHLKIMLTHQTTVIRKTIGFCLGKWCDKLKTGDLIDLVFEVDKREWNGSQELQLKIIDLRLSNKDVSSPFDSKKIS
ncbi:single-stranded-DNA-specific exonuclease RecJ [Candidatus Parcubacteria bacterium]|nr:MAG: single-stranded-DNA-specific exonuclease RecJ [Candidatus Parcubacteria bacterium]